MNPEQKADDRTPCVTDALIDGMVATHAGQCLAVVFWKKSVERYGARSNSVKLCIWGEQLDAHAPQRVTITNDSHGRA